jgi:hypothetical protein
MPFPVFIENPISAVYPLALLDTFEINSSSIKVPKSVKCLLGTFYVFRVSI